MPRPVKPDSKCPRYWYFRARYLAKKRGEKFSGKTMGPKRQPKPRPERKPKAQPEKTLPKKVIQSARINLMCKLAERISALDKLRARA